MAESGRFFFCKLLLQPLDFIVRILHNRRKAANSKPDNHAEKHTDEKIGDVITSISLISFLTLLRVLWNSPLPEKRRILESSDHSFLVFGYKKSRL